MATSTPYCYFTSSNLQFHPMLKKTCSFWVPKLSRKPIKLRSLKEICEQGSLDEAFQSFGSFLTDQTSYGQFCLDEAYSPVLELCASKKALFQGQQVHAHMTKSCSVSDSVFLSTKILFMYGKCGSTVNAEKVFDGMHERTIFTWNAMIGACVSNGEPLRALELYREMRVSGVSLDSCTFPCIVKACGTLNDLRCGSEIHGLAIKTGCDSVSFVVNSLVSMYAKCDDLNGARKLFGNITKKEDIVSWNSIISAYSANGKALEALELFREMQKLNVSTNTYTFVSALQACEDSVFEKLGMEIHAAILRSSHYFDVYVGNALLAMYVRCGKMVEAIRVFNNLEGKDVVSYNSMLSGYVQNGLYNEALQLFHYMQGKGKRPDRVSILNVIATCGRLGNALNGKEIHAYAIKHGLDSNLHIDNTLVDMYAKCSCVNFMDHAFDRMPIKDFISWTTIIAGYAQNNFHVRALELSRKAQMEGVDVDSMMVESILLACKGLKCIYLVKETHGYIMRRGLYDQVLQNAIVNVYGDCGNIEYANRMFEMIEYKDIVSWTSMLSCYVHNGLANEAFELLDLMRRANVEPDTIALVSILSAAASLSALNKGKEMHGFLIRKGFILEGPIAHSLVEMYASCGNLVNAMKVYNCVSNRDLVLWTTMINAYGVYGHGEKAIDLFSRMENEGLVPDHITFLALLHACSHSGLIEAGKRYFDIMKMDYQLEPWPEHYACFVDLLGRANRLEEAYQFVNSIEGEPTAEVWCALLGACRVHSNRELGEIVAQKLLDLDPRNPGNYVLISNVLASSGRWKDVQDVRMRMKGCGLKKTPGCSWIDLKNKVHTFMARDKSHPHSLKIYQKLAHVTKTLEREAGYVAQTKLILHNVEEEVKVEMLHGHSERLAIAYGLIDTPNGTSIRITKNLRICSDCHTFSKLVSKFFERELVVRDANRFHHFKDGLCSCGDFW
ncbi:DYW domain containing protein [Parasponia andersonii]|uniref:DYW domain containing protein n=1 Tax=Parasponia andersonii TaxID=3476 RepID=A0A2P5C054_PARAD|nr:DYW domain containing protein [Parasponia andersonii]